MCRMFDSLIHVQPAGGGGGGCLFFSLLWGGGVMVEGCVFSGV